MKRNEIDLSFCVWGFDDMTHDQISALLNLTPTLVYLKGQRKNPVSALAKENGWIFNSSLDKYSSFDDQMNRILDMIEARMESFSILCDKYCCEFSCGIFVYNDEESTPSVHLSSRYHSLAKKLRFEFDLDLYCLQNG